MATLHDKVAAEQRLRSLLREADLPQPDAVEYGNTCIRFYYDEPKTVVVIDLDEPPEGWPDEPQPAL